MSKSVIVLGGGGHAKIVVDSLRLLTIPILGITDKNIAKGERFLSELDVLGDDQVINSYHSDEIELVNGLGSLPGHTVRSDLFRMFCEMGYQFKTVVHPSAIVAGGVELSQGVQIMAGAVVQAGCVVGENSIINTSASIDHDCQVGRNVHIAPGAVLSGDVKVQDDVHIGVGATVIQGVEIGAGVIVGAGAVVTKNIDAGHIVYSARSTVKER